MLWYEQYPERLEYELKALKEAGFAFEIDPQRRAIGQLVLYVPYRISKSKSVHRLTVVFPPNYPYFAFQVYAPTLKLERHQDPFSSLICFVARIDEEWDASTDTVASYLRDRFPEVLKANDGKSYVNEAREAAPITGFMEGSFEPGSLVITGNWALPTDRLRGTLLIGLEKGGNHNMILRGAVHEVRDINGTLLGDAVHAIKTNYPGALSGRWVRMPNRPTSKVAEEIFVEAAAIHPDVREPDYSGGIDVLGIVFEDEVAPDERQDIWVFIVRCPARKPIYTGSVAVLPSVPYRCYLARADRGGRDDIQARVPRLQCLPEKRAAVFGLGALGSMVAWQLARAGVGYLNLIDYDHVQIGNSPRWMLGTSAAGFNKAFVLSSHLNQNYPFVKTNAIPMKVGAAPLPSASPQNVRMHDIALEQA